MGVSWKSQDATLLSQVSETVRAFSQGGGSGRVKMCEAAGVPLERYEQAQQKVDEKQDEWNKLMRTVKRCKKQAKPLVRAINGLRTRLKNNRAKVARLEAGGAVEAGAAAADESASDSGASGSDGSESDGEYAPGDKRKSSIGRASGSRSKRRRKSLSDSDVELSMFSSDDDNDSDDDSEEEAEVAVTAAKLKGPGPTTLPELQAQASDLQAELDEKSAIVKTLKADQRYSCSACYQLPWLLSSSLVNLDSSLQRRPDNTPSNASC